MIDSDLLTSDVVVDHLLSQCKARRDLRQDKVATVLAGLAFTWMVERGERSLVQVSLQ